MASYGHWTEPYPEHFSTGKCKRCKGEPTVYLQAMKKSRSNNPVSFVVGAYCDACAAQVMAKAPPDGGGNDMTADDAPVTAAGTDFRTWKRENLERLAAELTAKVLADGLERLGHLTVNTPIVTALHTEGEDLCARTYAVPPPDDDTLACPDGADEPTVREGG